MADIIEDFKSRKGRPALYPWATWADGRSRKIYQGQDFFSTLMSMRTQIHRKANMLGLRAHVDFDEANNAILVRFYDPKVEDND